MPAKAPALGHLAAFAVLAEPGDQSHVSAGTSAKAVKTAGGTSVGDRCGLSRAGGGSPVTPLVIEVREGILREALARAVRAEQKALGRLRAAQARYRACCRRTAEARAALARGGAAPAQP